MTTPDGWIWTAPVQCWPASTTQDPRPPFQCSPVGYTTLKLGADKGVGTLQLLTGLPRTRRGTVLRTCENPRVLSLRELLLLPLPPSPLLSLGLGALQIASISLMEANFPSFAWGYELIPSAKNQPDTKRFLGVYPVAPGVLQNQNNLG